MHLVGNLLKVHYDLSVAVIYVLLRGEQESVFERSVYNVVKST